MRADPFSQTIDPAAFAALLHALPRVRLAPLAEPGGALCLALCSGEDELARFDVPADWPALRAALGLGLARQPAGAG